MRVSAPLIGGAAIALAVALVWLFQPHPEPRVAPEPSTPATAEQAASTPPPAVVEGSAPAPAVATGTARAADPVPPPERSPLPGEAPATPIAEALAARQQNNFIVQDAAGNGGVPPQLVDGEREFAAEPIDATWAPGAEAKLLGFIAQMPGLELVDLQVECRSTMCRLQMTQPPASPDDNGQLRFNMLRDELGMAPRWMMAIVDGTGPPGPPRPGAAPRTMRSIAYLWREGFAPERAPRAADAPN
jgi:hypothetical protein